MHVTILGKRWNLRFVSLPNDRVADCDAPDSPKKEIRIASSLKGVKRLDATIHELLHASNWHLDENYVNQVATDIAGILWKLGYRKCE